MSRILLLLYRYSWIMGCSAFFHIAAADNSSLFQAIFEENVQKVETAIASGAYINQLDPCGGTPLHLAVYKDNLAIVKLLLEKGADVNAMANRYRPLTISKNLKRLKPLFIKAGVNMPIFKIFFPNSEKLKFPHHHGCYHGYHGTPLHIAAYKGNMKIAALLVAYGAILNSHSYIWDNSKPNFFYDHHATPLMVAVRRGHITLVEWFLQKGAPINDTDERGFTALYYALPRGLNMVQLLLDHGAYVNTYVNTYIYREYGEYKNILSFMDETPEKERNQIMDVLLKKGARQCILPSTKNTIAYLIEHSASLHNRDKEGNTPLYGAIHGRPMRTCQRTCQYFATCLDLNKLLLRTPSATCLDLNTLLPRTLTKVQQDNCGIEKKRKLWLSMLGGDLTQIKQMVAFSDMPINQSCQKGYVPLHIEIQMGHFHHVDDKIRITHGYTPLHLAAYRGHAALTEFLLTKGAHINAIDEQYGYTPLHLAAYQGHEKVVKLLIRHKASINRKEQLLGRTALHLAAATDNSTTVQYLIKHGAILHSMDKNQWTPLHVAIAANNTKEVIQLLIDQGVEETVLYFAAKEKNIDSIGYLIQKGIDINATDAAGKTALYYMAKLHVMEGCKLLIEAGADVNKANKKGHTPLHVACIYRSDECIDLLLQKGAAIHIRNNKGYTPLHWAMHSYIEAVETLLRYGADINAPDHEGNTPLHILIPRYFQDAVGMGFIKCLVAHGSNLRHTNHNGQTPFDLAIKLQKDNNSNNSNNSNKKKEIREDEIIAVLKPTHVHNHSE